MGNITTLGIAEMLEAIRNDDSLSIDEKLSRSSSLMASVLVQLLETERGFIIKDKPGAFQIALDTITQAREKANELELNLELFIELYQQLEEDLEVANLIERKEND